MVRADDLMTQANADGADGNSTSSSSSSSDASGGGGTAGLVNSDIMILSPEVGAVQVAFD